MEITVTFLLRGEISYAYTIVKWLLPEVHEYAESSNEGCDGHRVTDVVDDPSDVIRDIELQANK